MNCPSDESDEDKKPAAQEMSLRSVRLNRRRGNRDGNRDDSSAASSSSSADEAANDVAHTTAGYKDAADDKDKNVAAGAGDVAPTTASVEAPQMSGEF